MSNRLSLAIETLVGVFHEYASKDGGRGRYEGNCMDQFTLSKREFKELLLKELKMDNVRDPAKLEVLMKDLDDNGDGQLDFQEFVVMVVTMASLCNDLLLKNLTDN
ncbi:unnamed protein product [Knipowitschia caucasica]